MSQLAKAKEGQMPKVKDVIGQLRVGDMLNLRMRDDPVHEWRVRCLKIKEGSQPSIVARPVDGMEEKKISIAGGTEVLWHIGKRKSDD